MVDQQAMAASTNRGQLFLNSAPVNICSVVQYLHPTRLPKRNLTPSNSAMVFTCANVGGVYVTWPDYYQSGHNRSHSRQ